MKLFLILCFIYISHLSISQNYNSVVFSSLPQNLQLYPRNAENEGLIVVAGKIIDNNYNTIVSELYRENVLVETKEQVANNLSMFNLNHIIMAELANYSIKVYLKNNLNSTLIVTKQNIVCGDVFIVFGQSNAAPNIYGYNLNCEYCRSFGKNYNDYNQNNYNPADTLFDYASNTNTGPGIWVSEIIRKVTENYNIPVLAINGSLSGSGIEAQLERNYGLASIYDRAYYKAVKAGVVQNIKAIFYRQGEAEATWSTAALSWGSKFTQLSNKWRQDYGIEPKIYLAQLDIFQYTESGAGDMRDFQRRASSTIPNLTSFSVIGTPSFDGVHYGIAGHVQTGKELFRLVARDIYGAPNYPDIESPNIKKAYFTQGNEHVILKMQENQNIVLQKDTLFYAYIPNTTLTYHLIYNFYFNGIYNLSVQNISSYQNKIDIKLHQPESFSTISYLPNYYPNTDTYAFPGPYIRNNMDMRAFAFKDFPIGPAMEAVAQFNAQYIGLGKIKLSWIQSTDATSYQIYRSFYASNDYQLLTTVTGNNSEFEDINLLANKTYFYKIIGVNNVAETDELYSQANTPSCIETEINEIYSLQSGAWNNPDTWVCGQIPINNNIVKIKTTHTIEIPAGILAKAKQLIIETNAHLKFLGNSTDLCLDCGQ